MLGHIATLMEYTYTITLDDLMRYGEHVYRTSGRAKRTKRALCLLTPLFFAGWAAYYYWQVRNVDWLFIFVVGQSVGSAVFLPRFFDRPALKEIYRQFILRPEQSDTGLLRLIVEPDAVTEVAPCRETRRCWGDILRVEETDGYLYLFDTPKSAFIIPRHSFTDGRVYEELRRQIFEYARKRVDS